MVLFSPHNTGAILCFIQALASCSHSLCAEASIYRSVLKMPDCLASRINWMVVMASCKMTQERCIPRLRYILTPYHHFLGIGGQWGQCSHVNDHAEWSMSPCENVVALLVPFLKFRFG